MSYFGEDFLKGFFGADGLKDYSHAAKTFRTNGYELSPRYKFLFHVFFTINTGQIPALQNAFGDGDVATVGLMVKTVQLPTYTIAVDTMNQYNRKRLVQTKIDYNPVQIVFNDDQSDLIRNMWYNYYRYYYKDSTYDYNNSASINGSIGQLQTLQNAFNYNTNDIYENSRQVSDWGYIGEGYQDSLPNSGQALGASNKPPFFRDIKIYGLSQKKFASYVLINPIISEWQHDTYDYSQSDGTMINTMTIRYETVKYYNGYVGSNQPSSTVVGFADPNRYDVTRSGISRPGSQATVFGQGGLVDAGIGLLEDLNALQTGEGGLQNILGAVQKAGTAYETLRKNPQINVGLELQQAGTQILQASLPGAVRQVVNGANGHFFPNSPKNPTTQFGRGPGSLGSGIGAGVLGPTSRIGFTPPVIRPPTNQ
jgi:hypothetical protein